MFRAAPTLVTALAATLFAACVACTERTGGEETGGTGDTGLRAALDRVAANEQTRPYVEYGDVALLARLADGGKRYLALSGYGFSPIAPNSQLMAEQLGFDPAAMDGALVVGQPPDQAGLLWGDYDVDALDRGLAGRDVPAEDHAGGTRWTVAGDREIRFDGPLAGIARTSELNALHTAPGTFAYSSSRAGLDWVTEPGDGTLAADPVLGRIAGCLGEVAAAVVAEADGTTYGVGVRATPTGGATEVACLAPAGDPDGVREHVEGELADGSAPSTRQPWDELLPDATVELVESGSVVRIEAKPGSDSPVGQVMQMLQNRDLAALAGI